jgi:hypothetical protein
VTVLIVLPVRLRCTRRLRMSHPAAKEGQQGPSQCSSPSHAPRRSMRTYDGPVVVMLAATCTIASLAGASPSDRDPASNVGEASSISRAFTNDHSPAVPPGLVVAISAAAFVAALLVGIGMDAIARQVASSRPSSPASDDSRSSGRLSSGAGTGRHDSGRQASARDAPVPRESSYFFDTDTGVWSMRGLSVKNGASSIGFPLYRDVEDGCTDAEKNPPLTHVDLSDSA